MTALDGVAPLAGTTRVGTLLSIAERCGAADAEAVGAGARSASGTRDNSGGDGDAIGGSAGTAALTGKAAAAGADGVSRRRSTS